MITRRRFLELWHFLAALVAAGVTLPSFVHGWLSARSGSADEAGGADAGKAPAGTWIDLGSTRKIEEGEWVARTFELERRNRWRRESIRELIYIKRDGESFEVLSSICPHTGCLVRQAEDGFTCPCHKSFFDAGGGVVDGPSPRPLDALEWKVERRRLKVRFARFRPGVDERQVLPV